MADAAISIEGLADFRRALGRIDKTLNRGVRKTLKAGAEVVADQVRADAPRDTGRYGRSVRAFTRGDTAGVRVTATNPADGYHYPRRLEYEPAPRGRPVVREAFEKKRDEVLDEFDKLLDNVGDEWGKR